MKLSRHATDLIVLYDNIIKLADRECIPCYIASSIEGFTPSSYISALSELIDKDNAEIQNALRTADLNNYLLAINSEAPSDSKKLFEPLFAYPDSLAEEIPTVSIIFAEEEFKGKVVSNES